MPRTPKVLLIDGDIPVYRTSFACAEENIEGVVMHTAKKVVEGIWEISGCTHYMGFITESSGNFRIPRATTWPYKGQRETEGTRERPAWYTEIRKFYTDKLGFQMISGCEADDALTIAAEHLRSKSIEVACATIDKDLKQYPWDTYVDLNTDEVYSIDEETAFRNLWKQVLIGDKTDNIPGLSHAAQYALSDGTPLSKASRDFLLGEAGAEKLLKSLDPKDYAKTALTMYIDAYDGIESEDPVVRRACETRGIDFGTYRFYETFDLVYMLREAPKGLEISYDYHKIPPNKQLIFEDLTHEYSDR